MCFLGDIAEGWVALKVVMINCFWFKASVAKKKGNWMKWIERILRFPWICFWIFSRTFLKCFFGILFEWLFWSWASKIHLNLVSTWGHPLVTWWKEQTPSLSVILLRNFNLGIAFKIFYSNSPYNLKFSAFSPLKISIEQKERKSGKNQHKIKL